MSTLTKLDKANLMEQEISAECDIQFAIQGALNKRNRTYEELAVKSGVPVHIVNKMKSDNIGSIPVRHVIRVLVVLGFWEGINATLQDRSLYHANRKNRKAIADARKENDKQT